MGFKELKNKFFPETYVDEDERDYVDEIYEEETDDRAAVSPVRPAYETKTSYPPAGSGVSVASRSASLEMKVVSPTKYEAVTQIADILLDGKTVLLNLENTNKETAKRLIDFLSGVAYALGGDIQKVADNTFAVTPNNVAVSNEVVDSEYAPVDEGKYE